MKENELLVNFPKQIKATYSDFVFIIKACLYINKARSDFVFLNMRNTRYFSTNLLVILYFSFVEWINEEKNVCVMLPNGENIYGEKAIYSIFNCYARDKRAFFKPRFISAANSREKEDVLLKYLKRIELENYNIVKTLISEIFANIEMHTENKIGCISGHFLEEKNTIIVSIANTGYSIAKQLENKRGMIFEDDFSALMWSLKKNNSTRNSGELGGLGLYLLRKYLYELKGQASIITGKCYLELDDKCFRIDNENIIQIKEKRDLDFEFQGTIITLHIPYLIKKIDNMYNEDFPTINLLDIMEK